MYKSADTLYYTNLIVKNVTITIYLFIYFTFYCVCSTLEI